MEIHGSLWCCFFMFLHSLLQYTNFFKGILWSMWPFEAISFFCFFNVSWGICKICKYPWTFVTICHFYLFWMWVETWDICRFVVPMNICSNLSFPPLWMWSEDEAFVVPSKIWSNFSCNCSSWVHWKKVIRVFTTRLLSCCKGLICSVKFKSSPIDLFITNQPKPIKRFLPGWFSLKKTRQRSPSKVIKTLVLNQFLKLQKNEISRPN